MAVFVGRVMTTNNVTSGPSPRPSQANYALHVWYYECTHSQTLLHAPGMKGGEIRANGATGKGTVAWQSYYGDLLSGFVNMYT